MRIDDSAPIACCQDNGYSTTADGNETDTLERYIALPDGTDTLLLLEGRKGYGD